MNIPSYASDTDIVTLLLDAKPGFREARVGATVHAIAMRNEDKRWDSIIKRRLNYRQTRQHMYKHENPRFWYTK